MKKRLFCQFFHNPYRCYPDVGGLGLDGHWHCAKCHPCWEEIGLLG